VDDGFAPLADMVVVDLTAASLTFVFGNIFRSEIAVFHDKVLGWMKHGSRKEAGHE
jgi:hypothetical protein